MSVKSTQTKLSFCCFCGVWFFIRTFDWRCCRWDWRHSERRQDGRRSADLSSLRLLLYKKVSNVSTQNSLRFTLVTYQGSSCTLNSCSSFQWGRRALDRRRSNHRLSQCFVFAVASRSTSSLVLFCCSTVTSSSSSIDAPIIVVVASRSSCARRLTGRLASGAFQIVLLNRSAQVWGLKQQQGDSDEQDRMLTQQLFRVCHALAEWGWNEND